MAGDIDILHQFYDDVIISHEEIFNTQEDLRVEVSEAEVTVTNGEQTISIGNFVFLFHVDTSNAVFSDGSVRKVQLERQNHTVDTLTYFLKLPLICPVGISAMNIPLCMKQANDCSPSPAKEKGENLNFLTMHIDISSII